MTNIVLLALAICLRVESQGYTADTVPDGDNGRAVGVYQQWPCAVREANRIVGWECWGYDDRRNPQLARAMAKVTLDFHQKRNRYSDPVRLAERLRNPYSVAPEWHRVKLEKAFTNLRSAASAGRGETRGDE